MNQQEEFGGVIGRTFRESEPWWPELPTAPQDRPNVVIILFDDTGFSHLGCYGSTIATPNIDRLAANGLRFTNFHVTALCSPTRASLLTGRNHHAVGMRSISSYDPGYPNMRGAVSRNAATMAEMLRDENYATFAVGKWHLNPSETCSQAGPFHDWPLQRGFDRYYGFLSGETDQFYPDLCYDNHLIDPPRTPEEGYHFTEDIVDQATGFLRDHQSVYPGQPFFLYFALGATHSPHQAPAEYIERYRGEFDQGWDEVRKEWFARQLELGVIPEGTELAPRNPGVKPWDDFSPNMKRFLAAFQEAFAGFLTHTDEQIGRLISYLDDSGQLDNTILMLMADNGASQEGGPQGVSDTARYGQPLLDDVDEAQSRLHEIGGPRSSPNYPWGWSQAGNTPLKWYKQNTHGGGVRVPLIVHWPDRISDIGSFRRQFHHVSDVLPTVLESVQATAPEEYAGHRQMPVSGTSFAYAFDDASADTAKEAQYFEMLGHRGIWVDGWKAVTRHQKNDPWGDDEWELYHVAEDFSESNNLATENPEKLRELVDRWWVEAGRYGVLPLDDRSFQLGGPTQRPGGPHNGLKYRYTPPVSHLPGEIAPAVGLGSWVLEADIERDSGGDGVIFSRGSVMGGISFYIKDNRLRVDYNAFTEVTEIVSDVEVPEGRCTIGMSMDGEAPSAPGHVTIRLNGEAVGEGDVPFLVRGGFGGRGGADIGSDRKSPVTSSYEAPFEFDGTIHELTLEVTPYPKSGAAYEAARNAFKLLMAQQ
ncbi:MAG: arylsulfatase [Chloroflexi bacterium]|nr:arylsulfatase [Chloroflexota bacterium]